jgi:hypothetical protein
MKISKNKLHSIIKEMVTEEINNFKTKKLNEAVNSQIYDKNDLFNKLKRTPNNVWFVNNDGNLVHLYYIERENRLLYLEYNGLNEMGGYRKSDYTVRPDRPGPNDRNSGNFPSLGEMIEKIMSNDFKQNYEEGMGQQQHESKEKLHAIIKEMVTEDISNIRNYGNRMFQQKPINVSGDHQSHSFFHDKNNPEEIAHKQEMQNMKGEWENDYKNAIEQNDQKTIAELEKSARSVFGPTVDINYFRKRYGLPRDNNWYNRVHESKNNYNNMKTSKEKLHAIIKEMVTEEINNFKTKKLLDENKKIKVGETLTETQHNLKLKVIGLSEDRTKVRFVDEKTNKTYSMLKENVVNNIKYGKLLKEAEMGGGDDQLSAKYMRYIDGAIEILKKLSREYKENHPDFDINNKSIHDIAFHTMAKSLGELEKVKNDGNGYYAYTENVWADY